ncbi:MATE family efflux transporter [Qiania dongpingensis]|uniref:MATE family efflux transporter n=1 Tax=Qiania dongpingensis TaxID=2763669 RepID=A0A7G9G3P1_9FIRM|nr:MATE family efflux transporter [Qiania dongpingensis]QNM05423.1 MATE family efflux transporter [Qiania dongpingensis]
MPVKMDFINGNTRKCLFAMALPMIAAMFLNMAYNLVDSLWIGNLLGKTAYAALTNSTPIILILNAIAMGATNGVAILLSQAIGAKDKTKVESMIATSFLAAAAFALGMTVVLEVALRPLLTLLKTPEGTYQMAYEYLSIYLLGYITVYLYCYFTAVLRSFGNTVFQMAAMLVCTLLNALLDPLFIWWFGFQGTAAATLLSQFLCLFFMLLYLHKKKLFSLRISAFRKEQILPLMKKSVPSAFQQSIPAICTGFLTSLVSGYGITALAAYGIMGKLETILFYPAMALNMVLTSIVGQCAGGRRYDRVRDYLRSAVLYGGGLLAALSLLVIFFARPFSRMFVNSEDTAEIVSRCFQIVGLGYILNTVTNCFLGGMNGLGKPMKSMFCMVFYYMIVRMPAAWLLSVFGAGLDGVWTAVLISHVAAAIAAAAVTIYELRTGRRPSLKPV